MEIRGLAQFVKDLRYGGPRFALLGLWSQRKSFFSTANSNLISVRLPYGQRALVRSHESDFETLRQVFRDGQYELARVGPAFGRIMDRYSKIKSAGRIPLIVDAGANIGAATIRFKSLFPDAAVVAIEPDLNNVIVLRENVATLPGVHVLAAAIGSIPGFVELSRTSESWAIQARRAATGTEMVTVAQACECVTASELFIVKVDIEGFEADLFSTNTDWLNDVECVIIEPHDKMFPEKGTSASFQRAMAHRNFEIFILGENLTYVRGKTG